MAAMEQSVSVMLRHELKYLIDPDQERYFIRRIADYMQPDSYGLTSVASLYYDTPDCRLINLSLEKPRFKEKIRLRSYGLATDESPVFLEMKRKYRGVGYKRRVRTVIPVAEGFFRRENDLPGGGQIGRELVRFRDLYGDLAPSYLTICERTAFFRPGSDLRLTVDNAPRYRAEELDLRASLEGNLLLPEGYSVLEIKIQDAMPLWLSAILDEGHIYKTPFSKYGTAYQTQMTKIMSGGMLHV